MIPLFRAVDDYHYLGMRRSLGYKLTEHGRVLPQFAAFLAQREEPLITTALALQFAMQPAGASVVWWHQRLAIVRGFARYLQASDARHEVPPVNLLPAQVGGAGKNRVTSRTGESAVTAGVVYFALGGHLPGRTHFRLHVIARGRRRSDCAPSRAALGGR